MGETRAYHHGDLRAALLTAARAKLARDGYETLSLRGLARQIGVAPSAPYAHFATRDALLWWLIGEGARELNRRFGQAASLAATAQDRLAAACRSYLAFAAEQPEMLRLMFVSPLTSEAVTPVDASASLAMFENLVGDVMQAEAGPHVRETAITCWSVMHGFAMLRLHNRLAPDVDADAVAEAVIRATVRQARAD